MDLSTISRTGGPVLLWRGPDYDSLDLTGPVIANWVNKGVGLFGDYGLGPDFRLWVPAPNGLHWREVVAILSVLLTEGRVVVGDRPETDHHALVPFGHETDETFVDAEEVFVYNPPALSLSTPVDDDFIDVNSAIRAYPDHTARRLSAAGSLSVSGQSVDWVGSPTDPGTGPGRPEGLLVSNSTPRAAEWPHFLRHLLGGGEVLLATGIDDGRIADLSAQLGEVHGRLGAWTK